MSIDLPLAIAHHLLVLSLFAVVAAELLIVRAGMTADDVRRVGGIDISYGLLAVLILIVGLVRAIYASKGWEYYSANPFFQAKLTAFVIVGVLSIWPTVQIIRWRIRLKASAPSLPLLPEIVRVRQVLWAEMILLGSMPAFAAAMARG